MFVRIFILFDRTPSNFVRNALFKSAIVALFFAARKAFIIYRKHHPVFLLGTLVGALGKARAESVPKQMKRSAAESSNP